MPTDSHPSHRTRRLVTGVIAIAAATVSLVAYMTMGGGEGATRAAPQAQLAIPADTGLEPAVGNSGREEKADSASPAHAEASLTPNEKMRQRLMAATSFVDVYEELMGKDSSTLEPHEQFYLAFIVESCHFAETIPDTAAQQFAAAVASSAGDPDEAVRAKERVRRRNFTAMCAGIPAMENAAEFIADLYAAAAEAGDPRARAWQMQRSLEEAGDPLADTGLRTPSAPDPEQQSQLLDILASRDPMAIALAGPLLTRGYSDFGVAIGPEGLTPSPALQDVMWELLACDFGANCGHDRLQVEFACASSGRCNASSYYDYLQRYVLTPQDLQDFARMRPYRDAGLRSGNWSGVHFLNHNPGNYVSAGPRRFGLGG